LTTGNDQSLLASSPHPLLHPPLNRTAWTAPSWPTSRWTTWLGTAGAAMRCPDTQSASLRRPCRQNFRTRRRHTVGWCSRARAFVGESSQGGASWCWGSHSSSPVSRSSHAPFSKRTRRQAKSAHEVHSLSVCLSVGPLSCLSFSLACFLPVRACSPEARLLRRTSRQHDGIIARGSGPKRATDALPGLACSLDSGTCCLYSP
jgi:hypothetical protein